MCRRDSRKPWRQRRNMRQFGIPCSKWMIDMQLLNTLYVTTPESYIHLDNETLRVEVEKETRLRVPLHHLSCLLYTSRCV